MRIAMGQRIIYLFPVEFPIHIYIFINPKGTIHFVCGVVQFSVVSLHCAIQKHTRAHLLLKALLVMGSASDTVVSFSSE